MIRSSKIENMSVYIWFICLCSLTYLAALEATIAIKYCQYSRDYNTVPVCTMHAFTIDIFLSWNIAIWKHAAVILMQNALSSYCN